MKPEQFQKLPKWAQSEFSDLKSDLLAAKAFRFTDDVARDLPPPKQYDQLSKGWNIRPNQTNPRPFKACSSSVYHGDGWDKTSSQGCCWLFSTELKAWQALRRAVELECAKKLALIDAQIEQAKGGQS